MDNITSQIDKDRLPRHIAIIMDGNGRWAKRNGKPRIFGHRAGVKSVRTITEAASKIGVEYVTLYAFSTENWNRPVTEVTALMSLLVETVKREIKALHENGIKLNAIGDLSKLPQSAYKALMDGISKTKDNDRMTLTLALNYSARWEMTNAMREISEKITSGILQQEDINEALISAHLTTKDIPDPELLLSLIHI